MIIHPLDLNSKLRPPPRNFDWVFFVNIALIAMFFLFFGSRFILSPALIVSGSFNTPVRPASEVSYVPGTVVVSIKANGQIFTDTGLVSRSQLDAWLVGKVKGSPGASLLIRGDAQVSIDEIQRITLMAQQAGFKLISTLVEPASSNNPLETPAPGGAPAAGNPAQ